MKKGHSLGSDLLSVESVLNQVSDAVFVLDRELRYLFVNAAAVRLSGVPLETRLGRPIWEVYPESVGTVFEREIRRALDEQVAVAFEACFPATTRWVEVRAFPTPETLTVFYRDVTAQRQTAAEREYALERFQRVFDEAPLAILVTNAQDRRIVRANARMCALLGYTAEELLARRLDDITHPDDLPRSVEHFARAAAGQTDHYEIVKRYVRKDGVAAPIRANVSPIRDTTGRVILLNGMIEDIAEQAWAEQALRRSEERFRSLVEFLPNGVLLVTEGQVAYANPVAIRLFGASSAEQLTNRPALELAPADRRAQLAAELAKLRAEGGFVPTREGAIQRLDGVRVPVEASARAFDQDGRRSVLVLLGDMTERVPRREERESYQKRLRTLASEIALGQARERRTLAMEVHDEIAQNLAMARLQLRLGRRSELPEKARDALLRTEELVEAALERTRTLTVGLSPPALYEFGLEAALERLVKDMRAHHGLDITLRATGGEPSLDEASRVLLFRAARELLTNVVKHAHARRAAVTLGRENRQATLEVTDDGVGFDPAAPRSRDGFGLFSTRTQIEGLGGSLVVKSHPGAGTCVRVVVPQQEPPTS